jgi:hypothetical protein
VRGAGPSLGAGASSPLFLFGATFAFEFAEFIVGSRASGDGVDVEGFIGLVGPVSCFGFGADSLFLEKGALGWWNDGEE